MKKSNIVFLILIFFILGIAIWAMRMPTVDSEDYAYSDIRDLFESEQVKSFTLTDNTLKGNAAGTG